MGAVTGHKVVAQITDYGTNGRKPEGKIIEIMVTLMIRELTLFLL